MADKRVTPLAQNVPIVDSEGNPTLEFMLKWQQQNTINNDIPVLPATPGDPTKFLSGTTPSTWLTPPDTTYGVVTASAAGLAPTLPADATKYLDGSGAWSTPAGGGGGGGALASAWPVGVFDSTYNHHTAGLGNAFALAADVAVSKMSAYFLAANVGDEYSMFIAEINSSGTIQEVVVRPDAHFLSTAASDQFAFFNVSTPVTLTAGKLYVIVAVLLTGDPTDNVNTPYTGEEFGYVGTGIFDLGVMNNSFGAQTYRFYYEISTDNPAAGTAAAGSSNTSQYGVGFQYTLA